MNVGSRTHYEILTILQSRVVVTQSYNLLSVVMYKDKQLIVSYFKMIFSNNNRLFILS